MAQISHRYKTRLIAAHYHFLFFFLLIVLYVFSHSNITKNGYNLRLLQYIFSKDIDTHSHKTQTHIDKREYKIHCDLLHI